MTPGRGQFVRRRRPWPWSLGAAGLLGAGLLVAILGQQPAEAAPLARFETASASLDLMPADIAGARVWDEGEAAGLDIRLGAAAAREFARLTAASIGLPMTLSICGEAVFTATVQAVIASGGLRIGARTRERAEDFAGILSGETGCDGESGG